MKCERNRHHRRSIRLKGYDYSQPGAYFITICAYQRQCLFGEIVNGQMRLNRFGEIVAEQWQKSAVIRQEIELNSWVVIPDRVHGIVIIHDGDRVGVRDVVGSNRNDVVGANGRSPLHGWRSHSLEYSCCHCLYIQRTGVEHGEETSPFPPDEHTIDEMKVIRWNLAKNEKLKSQRGVSFEAVLAAINRGDLLDLMIIFIQIKVNIQTSVCL